MKASILFSENVAYNIFIIGDVEYNAVGEEKC